MSLKNALEEYKLQNMLKQQKEILDKADRKGRVQSDVVKHVKESEDTLQDVLLNGGECSVKLTVDGKAKSFKIAVHKNENTNLPEYKFHVKSALGYMIYIKAKDRLTAQLVINHIFGKGRYTVSASVLGQIR